jgi:protein-disulfide isomerase
VSTPDVPPKPRRTRLYATVIAGLALAGLCLMAAFPPEEPSLYGGPGASSASGRTVEELVTLRADGSILIAQPGVERPRLEIYEDYQCPYCKEFEQGNGKVARDAALRGSVALIIHPMTIFADSPMRENSDRALRASACVTNPRRWLAYHDALYAAQPSEVEDGGFAVPDLVALAGNTGIPTGDFAACISSEETSAKVREMSRIALIDGVSGTPTVRLDGQDIDWTASWSDPSV